MSLERYAFTSDGQRIIIPEKDFQQMFGDHTAWTSRPPLRTEYQFYPVSSPIPEDSSAELIPNITYVDRNTKEIMHCEVYPIIGPPAYPRGAVSNPSSALRSTRHGTPSSHFSPMSTYSPSSSAGRGSPMPDTLRGSNISSSPYLSSPSPGPSSEDRHSTHMHGTGDHPSPAFPGSPRDSIASGSRSPARRHATPVPLSRESRRSFSALYELGLQRPEVDGSSYSTQSPSDFPAEQVGSPSFAPVSPRTSRRASNASSRSRHATPTFDMSSPAPSPRSSQ
ncbi:hypothetical protein BDP27DRAFT_1423253 [Rhodocollybia butyracea]|uniref:Uncharacterized protein n=1 Tax=Rhodocollybia butyracea TaxID=206335 RepID=A0A9P5PPL0_9AGAR|nr:hypothetical protein BDP27DRAFT_1423253 [Rhodocollybia butyracea]